MNGHFPALIIVVPLFAALLVSVAGWVNRKYCFPLAVLSLLISFMSSAGVLFQVIQSGIVEYRLGGWPPPWGIVFRVDHLNAVVLVVISLVALINLIAGKKIAEIEFKEKIDVFYALYILFTTGLLGMTATGDAFNLYVLLEIASLTGYALIGFGENRAPLSALNYVFMGTIGASFYLLGIGCIYLVTGSLNMTDIAGILPALFHTRTVLFAFILCMTGLFIKMALFPLHAWLPNAYSYSPSVSGSLIAPLTTKVMIYVMIRLCLTVFTPEFSFGAITLSRPMVWVASIAIVAGAFSALAQTSLKKMFAYIIVSEVGYMVGGFWLGNRLGVTGAILHIINDALMTLCLFLFAGLVIHKLKNDKFERLNGIFRKMPFTMAGFTLAALSIIGVPPTCGFFSKWYLINGGIAAGHYGFVAALLFSSLVNVVLFFRVFEIGYFNVSAESGHAGHGTHGHTMDEAPPGMLVPFMVASVMLIVLGVLTGDIVNRIINAAVPGYFT